MVFNDFDNFEKRQKRFRLMVIVFQIIIVLVVFGFISTTIYIIFSDPGVIGKFFGEIVKGFKSVQ